MAQRRKRRSTLTRVRGLLQAVREHRREMNRTSQAERKVRARKMGWRYYGMQLALPEAAAVRIEEFAKHQGVPKSVVYSAILSMGLPHLSPAKVHAFWLDYRQCASDGPGYRERLRREGPARARRMWAVTLARMTAVHSGNGIAPPVPPNTEAADG